MAEWRLGRGWSEKELSSRLAALAKFDRNFPRSGPESQEGKNWRRYYSESIIGTEQPGPPEKDGSFFLAWKAITEYQFSDPEIVVGHFRPQDPLENRDILLELKVLGLRYLCGVRVGPVRQRADDKHTEYSFRYDTLQDHIEVGSEWFTLTKHHDTGELWFRISASWRPGNFPNWWSRAGFEILGRRYQLSWHRRAYLRLRQIVGSNGKDLVPIPYGDKLVHTGADISESELWLFNGKEEAACPHFEQDKSSLLPGPHQVSAGPAPVPSPRATRA